MLSNACRPTAWTSSTLVTTDELCLVRLVLPCFRSEEIGLPVCDQLCQGLNALLHTRRCLASLGPGAARLGNPRHQRFPHGLAGHFVDFQAALLTPRVSGSVALLMHGWVFGHPHDCCASSIVCACWVCRMRTTRTILFCVLWLRMPWLLRKSGPNHSSL